MPTQSTITRRLNTHRCVWCNNPLDNHSPSDVYDTEACQTGYMDWVSRGKPHERADTHNTPRPRADIYAALARADRQAAELESANRPGMLAPPRKLGELSEPSPTAIGRSYNSDTPALTRLRDPEPELDTYPWATVAGLRTAGWRTITACHPGLPMRQCSYCYRRGQSDRDYSMSTGVGPPACSHCRTTYPGPVAVPLTKPADNHTALAVATTRGVWADRYTPGLALTIQDVWDYLYRQAHAPYAITHHCHLRGCGHLAEVWALLAAPLTHAGHTWNPTDNEPLRIGMCIPHWTRMCAQLTADPRYQPEANRHTTRTDLIIIQ